MMLVHSAVVRQTHTTLINNNCTNINMQHKIKYIRIKKNTTVYRNVKEMQRRLVEKNIY
jgi:hypothetical protein